MEARGLVSYLIEAETHDFVTPRVASQKVIIVLGCITEACQVLTEDDDHVRALPSSFSHKLQLIETPSAGFVIASHDDLFLLYRKWQRLQIWIFPFENGGIKAVLRVPISVKSGDMTDHTNHNPILAIRGWIFQKSDTPDDSRIPDAYEVYNYPPVVPFRGRNLHGDLEDIIIIVRRSYSRPWNSPS